MYDKNDYNICNTSKNRLLKKYGFLVYYYLLLNSYN